MLDLEKVLKLTKISCFFALSYLDVFIGNDPRGEGREIENIVVAAQQIKVVVGEKLINILRRTLGGQQAEIIKVRHCISANWVSQEAIQSCS